MSLNVVKMKEQEPEDDLTEGMNIFALMKPEEITELLNRIDNQCSPLDRFPAKKREKTINWELVSFSAYGPQQCQAAWAFLRHQTRAVRILSEVVSEVKFKFSADKHYQTKLIESLPGYPQKPPYAQGGFHCFNRERWENIKKISAPEDLPNFVKFQRECREMYDALSTQAKQKYEDKSKLAMAEYKRQIKQFYAENPGLAQYVAQLKQSSTSASSASSSGTAPRKRSSSSRPKTQVRTKELIDPYDDGPHLPPTPAVNFLQSKLNKLDPYPMAEQLTELKHKFLNKWKSLSDRKRVKWINCCITDCSAYLENVKEYQQEHPGFSPTKFKISQLLTKDELSLWESTQGRPENPKSSIFEVFYEEFLAMPENANLTEEEAKSVASSKWKALDWYGVEMFTMKYKLRTVEYRKQLQEFFSGLPEFLKPFCLSRIHKKFHKMLEEVDKVPTSASDITATASGEMKYDPDLEIENERFQDNSPPAKRSKKDKKQKRNRPQEQLEMGDDITEYPAQNEDYSAYENMESESTFQEGPEEKKKKKKKKKGYEQSEERETVNEDVNFDSKMQMKDEETPKVKKPSSKDFTQNNNVPPRTTRKDIFEVIRGIFDGRSHLGRQFSVYYYYGKFVALEKYWIDSVNYEGLEKTALSIIQTFLGLPDIQKDHFIDKSWEFHAEKRPAASTDTFPGEPKPPPRRAQLLYRAEEKRKQRTNPNLCQTSWEMLPDSDQMHYVNKLYHETKLFLKHYDMFISSLTPNDLVQYALHRYRRWEHQMYTRQAVASAHRQFIFPFSSERNNFDVGEDSEPEMSNVSGPTAGKMAKQGRKSSNPFAADGDTIQKLTKGMRKVKAKRQIKPVDLDSDEPSDEEMKFSLLLPPKEKDRLHSAKRIKDAEKYLYFVDDLFEPDIQSVIAENPKTPISKKSKKSLASQGTQTTQITNTEMKPMASQTNIRGVFRKLTKISSEASLIKAFNKQKVTVANQIQSIACNMLVPKTAGPQRVAKVLQNKFAKTLPKPRPIQKLSLMRQDEEIIAVKSSAARTNEPNLPHDQTPGANTDTTDCTPEFEAETIVGDIPEPLTPVAEFYDDSHTHEEFPANQNVLTDMSVIALVPEHTE